ncbi:substrate-binding domain-containing protein [Myceligenerans indicum]|uniref:Substrate-binding domain-containing protein n=1 Tax=Myceligenerans indicum TaxID=2593663 RepID=A0ABS1LG90_9MICO|nr:substrate-binding domain-containing protein [Myceligenerans indicum]MBL0885230.1 substrate-binding domain-containing protein [Myceligenerans indicum]
MRSTLLNVSTTRPRARLLAGASLLAATIALAGCSGGGSGGPQDAGTDGAATGGEGVSIVVMGGATDDPFWSTVKRGGEAAAKAVEAAGGTVTFVAMPNYDNFNPDAAKLVANIDAMKPSAAVIPDWAPEAQNDNISAITSKGIPVFLYNTGIDQVDAVGAQAYIGSDDYESGKLAGETFAAQGAKHVACVNTLPGTTNADARCRGVKEGAEPGGAKYTEMALPTSQFGDPSAVAQAIKGAIIEDPTIDGIFTPGQADTNAAASGIDQAGRTGEVRLGGQNFDTESLKRIQDGSQLFAIDQQGFAQGYYGVSAAFQYAAYGITLPQDPLLTGPALIDADNVEEAISGTDLGVR